MYEKEASDIYDNDQSWAVWPVHGGRPGTLRMYLFENTEKRRKDYGY